MTYIDKMSFSKIRMRTKPKGIESRLFNKTIENSFNDPETVFCFARSMTFLSLNCSTKSILITTHSAVDGLNTSTCVRISDHEKGPQNQAA